MTAHTGQSREEPKVTPCDERPVIYVHTDHSEDSVRTFYEIPDALAERVRAVGGRHLTFAQALASWALGETEKDR